MSPEEAIAEVLAAHRAIPHGQHYWRCSYSCGWKYGEWEEHAAHVAAVVVAALTAAGYTITRPVGAEEETADQW